MKPVFNAGLVLPRGRDNHSTATAMAEPTHELDQVDENSEPFGLLPAIPDVPADRAAQSQVIADADTNIPDEMLRIQTVIAAYLDANRREERAYWQPIDERFQIGPTPYKVEGHGRRHNGIYVSNAVSIQIMIAGLGYYIENLGPGWNPLDLPEGAEIYQAPLLNTFYTAAPLIALMRYCDDLIAPSQELHQNIPVVTKTLTVASTTQDTASYDVGVFQALLVEVVNVSFVGGTAPKLQLDLIDAVTNQDYYNTGGNAGSFFYSVGSGLANNVALPRRIGFSYVVTGAPTSVTFTLNVFGIN